MDQIVRAAAVKFLDRLGTKILFLAFLVEGEFEDWSGTPWRYARPHPAGTDRDDDPFGDGMDRWGDPTDWLLRADWSDAANDRASALRYGGRRLG